MPPHSPSLTAPLIPPYAAMVSAWQGRFPLSPRRENWHGHDFPGRNFHFRLCRPAIARSRVAAHLASTGISNLLLDLVSAERNTQERIAFTLKTGKPLRN